MAIILETITHVWFAGRMIPPGEMFSADDEFATKLIEGGSAKVANSVPSKPVQQPKTRKRKEDDGDE